MSNGPRGRAQRAYLAGLPQAWLCDEGEGHSNSLTQTFLNSTGLP